MNSNYTKSKSEIPAADLDKAFADFNDMESKLKTKEKQGWDMKFQNYWT